MVDERCSICIEIRTFDCRSCHTAELVEALFNFCDLYSACTLGLERFRDFRSFTVRSTGKRSAADLEIRALKSESDDNVTAAPLDDFRCGFRSIIVLDLIEQIIRGGTSIRSHLVNGRMAASVVSYVCTKFLSIRRAFHRDTSINQQRKPVRRLRGG